MKPVLSLVGEIKDPWDDGGYQKNPSRVRRGLVIAGASTVLVIGVVGFAWWRNQRGS